MQLPFFGNSLFWASGDNLCLNHAGNFWMPVAFAAGVKGKPKHCKTLKVAKGPEISEFLSNICHVDTNHSIIVMVTYFSHNER